MTTKFEHGKVLIGNYTLNLHKYTYNDGARYEFVIKEEKQETLLLERIEFLKPKINPKVDRHQSRSGDVICKIAVSCNESDIPYFEYAFGPKFNYEFNSAEEFHLFPYRKAVN